MDINAGYLTSNTGTAWPFQADYPGLDRRVSRLFADGSATMAVGEEGAIVQVSDVTVSQDGLFFTLSKKINGATWDRRMHVDPDAGEYSVVRQGWCTLVVANHAVREAMEDGGFESDGPFPMDPAAVDYTADKVTTVSLYNHYDPNRLYADGRPVNTSELILTHALIVGDIRIEGGSNIYAGTDLARGLFDTIPGVISPISNIQGDAFVIGAIPGEGTGTVPCPVTPECGKSSGGGLIPDDTGDLTLEGDGCYQVSAYGGKVRITGRCTPCCQCESFVETGNRLGDQSRTTLGIKGRLAQDISIYNSYADRFNKSLCRVRKQELIVKCVAAAQRIDAGDAHPSQMRSRTGKDPIRGSMDRAQAVLTVGNASVADVRARIVVSMSPQNLVMANVVEGEELDDSFQSTTTKTIYAGTPIKTVSIPLVDEDGTIQYDAAGSKFAETVVVETPCDTCDDPDCHSCPSSNDDEGEECCRTIVYRAGSHITTESIRQMVDNGMTSVETMISGGLEYTTTIPSGASMAMRLYGARVSDSPSESCTTEGVVVFDWVECPEDPDSTGSTDSTDSTDSNDSNDSNDSTDMASGTRRTAVKSFRAIQGKA